jgi:hypothetical protein
MPDFKLKLLGRENLNVLSGQRDFDVVVLANPVWIAALAHHFGLNVADGPIEG